ncbi:MAG: SMP-30/gluconolactonase/LRE family protein [Eudoraea sp.]
MKPSIYFLLLLVFAFISCEEHKPDNQIPLSEESNKKLPYLTFQKENLFPGDGSLLRAEDGVFLEDERIVVVDQAYGLRLIEKDGSNRPFGNFTDAGFVHNPPENIAGPNGIVLEHDGKHILMSDVADGKIYRVNTASEEVEMIYDHPYGVNTIYRDNTGAIWFSQSTESTNLDEMFRDVNIPVPHGALFRMADLKNAPTKIMDSLYFANGITMDRDEKHLFISETMMDRVHTLEVDVKNGTTKYLGVAANVVSPDNILIDQEGRLIVASPLNNQVVAVDFKNHSQHIIFDGSTTDNLKISNEYTRISRLGMERLQLLSPDLFRPLPGLLTGMFFSNDGQTLYISNLGNDLIKLEYK